MVSQREWRWVLVVGAVALLLTSVPYLLSLALETEERLFGGFVYAVEDGYAYLAHMREGAEGAWLFTLPYTPEPHQPRLFYLFHLLLGKLATLLPGASLTARMVWVYHGARLLFGMGLLLTVYRFLAAFTADLTVRRLGFLLVAFGGGLGWLLVALGGSGWLGSHPLDFILPEGFTFLVLYAFPHIALARTLLLWGVLFLLWAWGASARSEASNPQELGPNAFHGSRFVSHALVAGLLWLAMGLIVSFYVAVAWAVVGAMLAALALRDRRVPWREMGLAALAGLLSAPVVAYSAWVFGTDPVYAAWAAQNLILSPHPLHYLLAFGVPLALAALAAPRVWREEGPGWAALAWVAVVPFLVYLPFNLQRRLVEGVQVPLSFLAAQGIREITKPRVQILRTVVTAGLLAVLVLTNGLLVGGNCLALFSRPAPVFREAGEVAALDWLNGQVRADDVVLAAYETGNYLPVRVGARSFVGHGPETVESESKRALVGQFFQAATDDGWRRDLLAEYGVDWIFWGPAERALGDYDPLTVPYLDPLYQGGEYVVLQAAR